MEDEHLVGVVTLENVREIREEAEPGEYTIEDIMTPSDEVNTVSPTMGARDALEKMQQDEIDRLIVTDDEGNLVGLLSRDDLMTTFNILRSSNQEPEQITSPA